MLLVRSVSCRVGSGRSRSFLFASVAFLRLVDSRTSLFRPLDSGRGPCAGFRELVRLRWGTHQEGFKFRRRLVVKPALLEYENEIIPSQV